jgi:lipoprotein-anchoring transpeptidase ErfK/SrfK
MRRPDARKVQSACVAVVALALTAPQPAAAAQPPVPAKQELAALRWSHAVVSTLAGDRPQLAAVRARRPITGGATVLPVLRHKTALDGTDWLRVRLPGRPNGLKGWIRRRGTVGMSTHWHVVASRSDRRVRVYRRSVLVRKFAAIVGKPSTPTPTGRFFNEESVRMSPHSAGAPFALALSARSDVLQEFAGGPGQIAIHGVANLIGTPGTAVSHGCVRLSEPDIRWLAARIAAGVPVTITR